MSNPTVENILRDWLKQHGYDGLYYDECGCSLDNFMPCGEVNIGCKAGYQRPDPTGDCDYLICPEKPEAKKQMPAPEGG